MSTICIIPARGGSRRIQLKNIKEFHGKPIISYPIEIAKESGLFDEIIVSTDSKEIADISRRYGATIHNRSDEMARDEVGTQKVVGDAIYGHGIHNGYVCCIYATAPLMSVDDLKKGLRILKGNPRLDYAFSVGTNPLRDAGQFYWGWASSFLENLPLVEQHTAMIPIAPERVCDINVLEDFSRAEKMYKALHPPDDYSDLSLQSLFKCNQ